MGKENWENDTTLTIRLPGKMKESIQATAVAGNISMAEAVREKLVSVQEFDALLGNPDLRKEASAEGRTPVELIRAAVVYYFRQKQYRGYMGGRRL